MTNKRREELTEEQVADSYQERQGDMSGWVPIERPVRRRGAGATSTFAVRLTPEEIMELKAAAEVRQLSTSEFIRNAALATARTGEPRDGGARRPEVNELIEHLRASIAEAQRHLGRAEREIRTAVSEARFKASA